MALEDYVVLGVLCVCAVAKRMNMAKQAWVVICVCAVLKRMKMAKQAARWRDKELLAEERVARELRQRLAPGRNENRATFYENRATFFRTSTTHMDEALHEYKQALETAVFESTKQLLQEHIRRMNAHRSRIMNRWQVIAHMEPSLLEMLDECGYAKWAERLLQIGVRQFGNLAGLEAGELMNRLPGLPPGTASLLVLESRERRARRVVHLQPGARG